MSRLLPLVLIFVATWPSPSLARKWTARSGGFSVEAELVDFRDGHAVLKKEDGTEVSVPLSKLSLADVRYIESVIKAAEEVVGGRAEGMPTPVTSTPPSAETAQESAARKGRDVSPRSLRYRWTKDQTFQYRVKTELQLSAEVEALEGTVHYGVKSVSSDGVAEVAFFEYVTRSPREGADAALRYLPFRSPLAPWPSRYYPGRYPPLAGPEAPEVIKVDRQGRIVSMTSGSRLPLFLGRAAHQPFEPLSPLDENPWTVVTDIALRTRTMDWLTVPGLGSSRPVELPGREKSIYTLQGSADNLLTVKKTYEAASAALVDGKPQVAISAEGVLTFDLRRGLFASSVMKVRVAVHEGAVRVEVPIQVSYQLVSEEEEAQQKAAADKLAKESAEMVKEMNRPVTIADLPELIEDLQSADIRKATAARSRLRNKSNQPGDRKFAAAVEKYLQHDNEKVREAAAEALAACATSENLPALLKLLDSDSTMVRHYVVQALGRLKSPAAIDRLVERLAKGDASVVSALTQIGPAVEPAMLKLFSQGDRAVRQHALQVLMQVGTAKSLPVLEKFRNNADPLSKALVDSTIQLIRLRQ